ncbi:MAG TPA: hypothetical protein PKM71_04300 [Candidatus Cloacimonas sp.]|nr:hypothetical protein [Candidatus Cloacimonas sp.]
MKLPEIQTKKKIRDAHICSLLVQGKTKQEIADKVGLTIRTIDRIIYKNSTVLKNALELTKDHEKVNRILFIKNQMRISKKFDKDLEYSPMTLMEDLKEELEGTQPLIDNSKHITNITINKTDLDERVKLLQENRCSALI